MLALRYHEDFLNILFIFSYVFSLSGLVWITWSIFTGIGSLNTIELLNLFRHIGDREELLILSLFQGIGIWFNSLIILPNYTMCLQVFWGEKVVSILSGLAVIHWEHPLPWHTQIANTGNSKAVSDSQKTEITSIYLLGLQWASP